MSRNNVNTNMILSSHARRPAKTWLKCYLWWRSTRQVERGSSAAAVVLTVITQTYTLYDLPGVLTTCSTWSSSSAKIILLYFISKKDATLLYTTVSCHDDRRRWLCAMLTVAGCLGRVAWCCFEVVVRTFVSSSFSWREEGVATVCVVLIGGS